MTKKRKPAEHEPDLDEPGPVKPEPDKPEPDPEKSAADIVGTWVRQEPDAAPYPDEITFDPDGIYSGKKASGSAVASKLDVGVFDRIDETSIRMSTATDRDETFDLDVSEDDLKLIDEEGKELSYKRKSDVLESADVAPNDPASPEADEPAAKGSSNEEWMP
jgi:hypothetical protein